MALYIDEQKCIGCGRCVEDCLVDCLALENGRAVLAKNLCISCGHCVAVCPENAVSLPQSRMDLVEELSSEDMQIDPIRLQRFLSGRRSIRRYLSKEVEREKLEAVLEAGRMSPTASNRQNLRFVVLQKELPAVREMAITALARNAETIAKELGVSRYQERLEQMRTELEEGQDPLFFHAPVVIVVIEKDSTVNGAMAASRMELIAAAQGLGVCFNGFFGIAAEKDPQILERLGCNSRERIAMTFALGYTDLVYQRTAPRKDLRVQWM